MPSTRKTSPLLTIVNAIAAVLFAAFAYLQMNDLDPEIYYKSSGIDATLWFLFYAFIAILFVVAIFRSIPRWLLIVGAIACVVEMVTTFPGLWENVFGESSFTMTGASMSAEDPRVELSREFFGAFIALLGVLGLLIQQKKKTATNS